MVKKKSLTPPPELIEVMTAPSTKTEGEDPSLDLGPSQALQEQKTEALWTSQKLELLKNTIAKGLDNNQLMLFVEVCRRRRLDPFAGQIVPVVRGGKMVIQTTIDGFRLNAERSGKYLGQTPPYWCGKDGVWTEVWTQDAKPFAAKVGVYKAGKDQPTWGIAYLEMYQAPGPFWNKGAAHMLAKCAEALALKKAFPEELSGLFTHEEMMQADTMVWEEPVAQEPEQPVLIFPKEISQNSVTTTALVIDTQGSEWLFPLSMLEQVDAAVTQSAPLLITYEVKMNRRVVMEIVG